MFEVGDEVELIMYEELYKGIVKRQTGFDKYEVEFFATGKNPSIKAGYSYGVGEYWGKSLRLLVYLTTEQKVLKKIKYLDQKFAERQAQKAKEKENANRVSCATVSVQSNQRLRPSIGEWVVYTETPQPRVEIRSTYG